MRSVYIVPGLCAGICPKTGCLAWKATFSTGLGCSNNCTSGALGIVRTHFFNIDLNPIENTGVSFHSSLAHCVVLVPFFVMFQFRVDFCFAFRHNAICGACQVKRMKKLIKISVFFNRI